LHRTATDTAKKTRGKPFRGGPDPRRNKGGRPQNAKSVTYQVRELFGKGKKASELAQELHKLTKHLDPRVRLAAIKEVLDRCDGKAPETLTLNGDVGLTVQDARQIAAARRMIDWLRKRHTPQEVADCLRYSGIEK